MKFKFPKTEIENKDVPKLGLFEQMNPYIEKSRKKEKDSRVELDQFLRNISRGK